jgi:hypothetical protein
LSQHQDLHITLTLLIGVALGCGVLYWSGRSAAPAPLALTRVPATSVPATVAVDPSIPKPVTAQPIEPKIERVRDDLPVARIQPQETPPTNYDGPDLPIVFAFSERSLYTTEEDAEGNLVNASKRVKEGIISNSSDKPLTITATEVNIATQETSQTQFVLSGGTQKHFGTEQGLKMIAGDQMTLRSLSYKDFVQQIP